MDIKWADHSKKFQETVCFPSTKGLINMIDNCVIKNIPIFCHIVQLLLYIYEPKTNILKEKIDLKVMWICNMKNICKSSYILIYSM